MRPVARTSTGSRCQEFKAQSAQVRRHLRSGTWNASRRPGAPTTPASSSNLLSNEDSDDFQTDFYSYRYFASEGFLPGYSFPRLPLAAYIPGLNGRREGDYIQRPRFIGIAEFGPGAVIYHEGARYQVVSRDAAAVRAGKDGTVTTTARRCGACGYLHVEAVGIDLCENCREPLARDHPGPAPADHGPHRSRRDRISSDEEERRRSGFELQTSYRFAQHGAKPAGSTRPPPTTASETPQPRLRRLRDDPDHQHRPAPPRQPRRPRLPDRRDHGPLAQGERARRDPGRRRPGSRRQDQAQAAGHPLRRGPPQHPGHPAGRAGEPGDRDHRRDRAGARHRGRVPARGQRAVQRGPARSGRPGPRAVHRERRGRRWRAPPPGRRPGGAAQGRPHRPGDHALRPGHRRGGQRRPPATGSAACAPATTACCRTPTSPLHEHDRPPPGPRPDAEAGCRRGGTRVRSG